jgi:hypothetical protein
VREERGFDAGRLSCSNYKFTFSGSPSDIVVLQALGKALDASRQEATELSQLRATATETANGAVGVLQASLGVTAILVLQLAKGLLAAGTALFRLFTR